ncbi:MAG TPA: MFS transporter [Thermoanaerobaculia bacterium]
MRSDENAPRRARGALRAMPAGIWALGFVSLAMDVSSELVHSLLPVFLVAVLGASLVTVGWIEGVAEATAAVSRVFSGALSDRLGRRKPLAVAGYGLSALTKLIFPLASTVAWVFAARFLDRVGKGVRGAPRDALVAEIAPLGQRGAAFGLRQALDSVGAVVGPLAALALMLALAGDLRRVLWIAVAPAFLAVGLLVVGVREPGGAGGGAVAPRRSALTGAALLPRRFWRIVVLGAVFTLARFSEAFLVLRAQDVGLALRFVPLALVAMNVVYALSAYPAGAAADRTGARRLLLAGLGTLIGADLVLAAAAAPSAALVGAALWGLHMGLTQGLFAKLVADSVPAERRGTAFGVFHLVGGAALLAASVVAGALWSAFGAPATFLAGAAFAALAALGLLAERGVGSTA